MAKRSRTAPSCDAPRKRIRTGLAKYQNGKSENQRPLHPVLVDRYSSVGTLRDFVLKRLPQSSHTRRKHIDVFAGREPANALFLDHTWIGLQDEHQEDVHVLRRKALFSFTQSQRSSSSTTPAQICSIKALLHFAIWTLFNATNAPSHPPNHILCHGLERSIAAVAAPAAEGQYRVELPGIVQKYVNDAIHNFLTTPWPDLLKLLGADGERIFLSLLLDCGIFTPLDHSRGSLHQISGVPVFDINSRHKPKPNALGDHSKMRIAATQPDLDRARLPSGISFVRSRMLYGKPAFNKHGRIQFGLKHMHIFNRSPDLTSRGQTVTILKYVFPRQFGLHNVFTSKTDKRTTAQPFQDYTFRKEVICSARVKVPKRLRSGPLDLASKIRRNHSRCSYTQLLAHYCPIAQQKKSTYGVGVKLAEPTQSNHPCTQINPEPTVSTTGSCLPSNNGQEEYSFLPFVISPQAVSAFVCAVLRHILPQNALGTGETGKQNWFGFLSNIRHFVEMRRYESMSLQEVLAGLKVSAVPWLRPPKLSQDQAMSISDKLKREELLQEFVYYVVDSLVMPLLAGNFYVTESGIHRNKLLFFRQDVWQRLTEPTLAYMRIKARPSVRARAHTAGQELTSFGVSIIRLLPKETGTRPITNLKRRPMKTIKDRCVLGQSINTQLTPLFNVMNLERRSNKDTIFGKGIFSVKDIHSQLSDFAVAKRACHTGPFFFVKVDIKSAFDSIPHGKLLQVIVGIFSCASYSVCKVISGRLGLTSNIANQTPSSLRYLGHARKAERSGIDDDDAQALLGASKRDSIVYTTSKRQEIDAENLRQQLVSHVCNNVLRVGRKQVKQKEGIPQGSILSSLLCTIFYNDFEEKYLDFMNKETSLLLRLIDDFLLITTSAQQAARFVTAMREGSKDYGIVINAEKSLVNFDMTIGFTQVPRLSGTWDFPYCGLLINTKTLEVTRDRQKKDTRMVNALTIDRGGKPGVKFRRRIIASLRIQLHSITLDGKLNNRLRVLQTLLGCFGETAIKMHLYRAGLPQQQRPAEEMLIGIMKDLINQVISTLVKGQSSILTRSQVCWAMASAVLRVLSLKQTQYKRLMTWLLSLKQQSQHSVNLAPSELDRLLEDGLASLSHYVY